MDECTAEELELGNRIAPMAVALVWNGDHGPDVKLCDNDSGMLHYDIVCDLEFPPYVTVDFNTGLTAPHTTISVPLGGEDGVMTFDVDSAYLMAR